MGLEMILNEYTKQKDLDSFSDRWGCYSTVIYNILESELGHRLEPSQVCLILGRWLLTKNVYLSNYKDHDVIFKKAVEKSGWGEDADPEAHYYVARFSSALRDGMWAVGISKLRREYWVLGVDLTGNNKVDHFTLELDDGTVVNPDESLNGAVKTRAKVNV